MDFFSDLLNALPGALAQGLIWGLMAIGVYITFKVLDLADLTVDGTMCTGGAVCIMLMTNGVNVWVALLCAFIAGMIAGAITGPVSYTHLDSKGTYTVKTDKNANGYTKVAKDYSDLMGQKVDVLVKISDNTVYGVYANEDSKVLATGAVGQLDTVSNDTKKMKLNGVEYKFEKTALSENVVYNNDPDTKKTLQTIYNNRNANASDEIKFIDNNGDGKVDSMIVTPMTVAEVTYVGSTSITAGNKSYKFEDDDIYEGVAKNDWAVIVAGDYTTTDNAVITKAGTIEGEVTGVRTGSPDEVKIGDDWYKMATNTQTPAVGDKGVFVVVNGYVYDADASGSSKDILYISANEAAESKLGDNFTVEAKAYFTDGTNKVDVYKRQG